MCVFVVLCRVLFYAVAGGDSVFKQRWFVPDESWQNKPVFCVVSDAIQIRDSFYGIISSARPGDYDVTIVCPPVLYERLKVVKLHLLSSSVWWLCNSTKFESLELLFYSFLANNWIRGSVHLIISYLIKSRDVVFSCHQQSQFRIIWVVNGTASLGTSSYTISN